MESTLFVPVNLSFSENLRCLKMPLLVGAISQKRWPSETCFVFAGQNVNSGKFKHLKYSENVKFAGTNYIDSILGISCLPDWCPKRHGYGEFTIWIAVFDQIIKLLLHSKVTKVESYLIGGYHNEWVELTRNLSDHKITDHKITDHDGLKKFALFLKVGFT